MSAFTLYCPKTVKEAIELQKATMGTFIAGGTVSLVNRKRGKDPGDAEISLLGIEELKGITSENGYITIGSMVTMDEIESSGIIKKHALSLWQAASDVGGPQIRNMATLGGNLAAASPSSDCAVPLLALNAVIIAAGADGEREIPVRSFFTGYLKHALKAGEIITKIKIPVYEGAVSAFRKAGKRNALAISCINMAVSRNGSRIDVSAGACAPVPVYCEKTSSLLSEGGSLKEAEELILTEISPIDDRYASASYRKKVCVNMLSKLLEETGGVIC